MYDDPLFPTAAFMPLGAAGVPTAGTAASMTVINPQPGGGSGVQKLDDPSDYLEDHEIGLFR